MKRHEKTRAFGQNFLKDTNVIQSIVDAAILPVAEKKGPFHLLEIGPGRGALTFPILERLKNLQVDFGQSKWLIVERDRDLAEYWQTNLKDFPWIEFKNADFLRLDLKSEIFSSEHQWNVVSNLPYSVGTAIVNELAFYPNKIEKMTLMFQKEVADRISATVGTKAWGSLSLSLQNQWEITNFLKVPPQAFRPAPKVDSAVLSFFPREKPMIATKDKGEFETLEKLWRLAFSQRRKMLRGVFPSDGPWRNALLASGVDGTLRAEQLTWNDWEKIFSFLISALKA